MGSLLRHTGPEILLLPDKNIHINDLLPLARLWEWQEGSAYYLQTLYIDVEQISVTLARQSERHPGRKTCATASLTGTSSPVPIPSTPSFASNRTSLAAPLYALDIIDGGDDVHSVRLRLLYIQVPHRSCEVTSEDPCRLERQARSRCTADDGRWSFELGGIVFGVSLGLEGCT